jgi:hypothetical protein
VDPLTVMAGEVVARGTLFPAAPIAVAVRLTVLPPTL